MLLALPTALALAAAAYLTVVRGHHHDIDVSIPSIGRSSGKAEARQRPVALPAVEPIPRIRMSSVDAFSLNFRKPPRAGLLFDLDNGDVLWRLHPYKRLPIASLTKIMTALIVTERAGPNERVLITRPSLHAQGSAVGVLPKHKRVRLEALLNGLLIVSGNDAAVALADHVAGTERRFAVLMNRRARQLGLRCTRFVTSYGLQSGNRSCAHDLAVLARLAMRNRRIARIVRRRRVELPFPIKGGHLFLYGHNPLMEEHYRGTIGLKTGFTDPAGRCLVGIAKRGAHTLGVVLLHSPNPGRHGPRLLNLGFRELRG